MRHVKVAEEIIGRSASEAYAKLCDFGSYPGLSEAVLAVTVSSVDGRAFSDWEVRFREGILRWKEEDSFHPERWALSFRQIEGDIEHFAGEWSIAETANGCLVCFTCEFDLGIAGLDELLEPIAEEALCDNVKSIINGLVPESLSMEPRLAAGGRKMRFLGRERHALESLLPGLDKSLAELPLMELEKPDNPGIALFRKSGGAGILIPKAHGGHGASAVDAVRIQRAIGSRSPSLAIATAMHQFSLATLVEFARERQGPEMILLDAIARQGLLIASGFAEGLSGRGILDATMRATRKGNMLIVNGSKKPCSLTYSMDLLTASAAIEGGSEDGKLAIVLVSAKSEGIERRRFWGSNILGGAESDEVILRDVAVPEQLTFISDRTQEVSTVQLRGFLWFELLITASYLGVASLLVERVFTKGRGSIGDRALLATELEAAMTALEGAAGHLDTRTLEPELLPETLLVRFAIERAIERATDVAVAALGGMAFIQSPEVGYLLAASRGLAFHPPSRGSVSQQLCNYVNGEAFAIP